MRPILKDDLEISNTPTTWERWEAAITYVAITSLLPLLPLALNSLLTSSVSTEAGFITICIYIITSSTGAKVGAFRKIGITSLFILLPIYGAIVSKNQNIDQNTWIYIAAAIYIIMTISNIKNAKIAYFPLSQGNS